MTRLGLSDHAAAVAGATVKSEPGLTVVDREYEKCRAKYPTVALSPEEFRNRVTSVLSGMAAGTADGMGSAAWSISLEKIHCSDLFLATACALGNRIAWECFADEYLALIRGFAVRSCRSLDEGEELAQEIVSSLLEGSLSAGAVPGAQAGGVLSGKLAGYTGRGPLAGWLRVVVAHAAIDGRRRKRPSSSLDEMMDRGRDPSAAAEGCSAAERPDPGEARWAEILSGLLATTIAGLPARDRLLLALYYAQGVSLKQIGRQFGFHEATASRRLDRLRRRIRTEVERSFRRRHRVSGRELDRIWRSVTANDSLSLAGVLGVGSGDAGKSALQLQDPPASSSSP
ncbi:MAG: sigma-70 family RNA polymerase sigma factor [Candidatus Aminicenantes bacterium]|nr:sigma-70 family RNA polymerase sigma factor [Candidatus Aminicenantes bacterium]